ncbi:Protein of unknown function [Pyronema omphalodes CBS 100304]|uniref:Uncharacterized protein n=1 Tax=Pyronema omphalodes (strain CBS 100304) TaxID=1076935 RepID=U4L1V0_PYROM|nr:Protein of unknown function [Pyronema omphalodes CBS 100304]
MEGVTMGSTQFKRYQLQPRIIQRKFEYDTLFSFLFDDSMKCLRGEIRNKYPNRDGFRGQNFHAIMHIF